MKQQILNIIKELHEEITSELTKTGFARNYHGDFPECFFLEYVLAGIPRWIDSIETDRFDSLEKFTKYMDQYASIIYAPDCTCYADEYRSAAISVKDSILSKLSENK